MVVISSVVAQQPNFIQPFCSYCSFWECNIFVECYRQQPTAISHYHLSSFHLIIFMLKDLAAQQHPKLLVARQPTQHWNLKPFVVQHAHTVCSLVFSSFCAAARDYCWLQYHWTDLFGTKNHFYGLYQDLPACIQKFSDMASCPSCYLVFYDYISNNVFLQQGQCRLLGFVMYIDMHQSQTWLPETVAHKAGEVWVDSSAPS